MLVELSKDDARLLKEVLQAHLGEMQVELVHTDNHAYRAELKADLEQLEKILESMEEQVLQVSQRAS